MRKSADCSTSLFTFSVTSRKYQARPVTVLPLRTGTEARESTRPSFSSTRSSLRTSSEWV